VRFYIWSVNTRASAWIEVVSRKMDDFLSVVSFVIPSALKLAMIAAMMQRTAEILCLIVQGNWIAKNLHITRNSIEIHSTCLHIFSSDRVFRES
jgi:hypothetical protein